MHLKSALKPVAINYLLIVLQSSVRFNSSFRDREFLEKLSVANNIFRFCGLAGV